MIARPARRPFPSLRRTLGVEAGADLATAEFESTNVVSDPFSLAGIFRPVAQVTPPPPPPPPTVIPLPAAVWPRLIALGAVGAPHRRERRPHRVGGTMAAP